MHAQIELTHVKISLTTVRRVVHSGASIKNTSSNSSQERR